MARAKRRSNREGSIWQRKDGRWTGAAYVLTTSGAFKRVYVYGQTRDEVHVRLLQLQDTSARGIPRPVHGWKVGQYLDYWLAEVAKPMVRPTTYAEYETMVRLYLRPGLGRYRLDRLSVVTVQAYLNCCLQAGDSSAKVHAIRKMLSAALTRAMREELVQRNVARLATLPPERPARQKPWSADEARRFLDAALRDPMYPAFVLLLVCGLRRGEVLGLSWRDVDFEHGIVRIRQQLVRAGNRLHIGPVKTAAGRRELPLLGLARDALASHAEMRLIGGTVTEWTSYELVFATRTGHPIEPRNLARSFKRITTRAGLRPIRLHDLRHTTATLLKNLGVAPRDAMEILGHSRISVTLEIYTDGDEDTRRRALKRLSEQLGRAQPSDGTNPGSSPSM
jgi:integrase